ncbi:Cytosolic carboxypeptidase NnaD [Sesbania bispinosa]|nr:Cytosolic carboxypeptidase NnaD [Sesbania bispinosa]
MFTISDCQFHEVEFRNGYECIRVVGWLLGLINVYLLKASDVVGGSYEMKWSSRCTRIGMLRDRYGLIERS